MSSQRLTQKDRSYFLVTAAHVIGMLTNDTPYMMVAKKGSSDSILEPCLGRWHKSVKGTDVCALEITDSVRSLISKGAEFRCIATDVDSTNHLSRATDKTEISGVGTLQKYLFGEFHIGMGTPCSVIGTCCESWEGQEKPSEVPLICRSGQIAQVPLCKAFLGRERNGKHKGSPTELFLTDIPVIGGMSGSPVFVKAEDALGHWYLAGIMVSQVPGKASDEVELLRAKGAEFKVDEKSRLIVSSVPYQHLGNTYISAVIPYEEILGCVSAAEGSLPSVIDCFR